MNSLLHILFAAIAGAVCGALSAGIAGLSKATVGAHEVISTIMLNWIAIWIGVFLFGLGGPLQNDTQTYVASRTTSSTVPSFPSSGATPTCRACTSGSRRDRSTRRLLAPPQSDDARLRRQSGRLQPGSSALQRHQRLAELLPCDGNLGRLRRARRRGRCPGLAVQARDGRRPGSDDRVRRDRRSAARPQHRDRGRARCTALRRSPDGNVDAESHPEIFKPGCRIEFDAVDSGPRRALRRR